MATALAHISRAYRMIGVVQDSEVPTAAQTDDALTALVAMFGAWEAEGVPLGLTGATIAAGTTIPVPATHDEAIQTNLAMRLSIEFGAPLSPVLADRADVSYRTLQAQYLDATPMSVEPALLRGGGIGWREY